MKNHPKQKSGKAAGPESIPPEALNSSIEESTNLPYILFEKIWQEEDVPRDWKEGYIVKIPKKRDLQHCGKYRGISLLSVLGKVLNRIILGRMTSAVDCKLREHLRGWVPQTSLLYRADRCTMNHNRRISGMKFITVHNFYRF